MHFLHWVHDYATSQRACFAIVDDFGALQPCTPTTWWMLYPQLQLTTLWA